MSSPLVDLSQSLASLVESAKLRTVELLGARVPASATWWSPKGLAVTVAHAMGDNDQGFVVTHDGQKLPARVLGRDPSHDLALLQIDAPAALLAELEAAGAFAHLSTSDEASDEDGLRVGELALTLGLARRRVSATLGMVSDLGPAWRTRLGGKIDAWIDVDAALPRGSAGGPLLSSDGRLLAINTHGLTQRGASIPLSTVARTVERLEARGDLRPGFLGVRFQPARLQGHPSRERALVVTGVQEGGPAAEGGVSVGDIILEVDGQAVQRGDDLLAALSTRAGEPTEVELWRAGTSIRVELTPVARPRFRRGRRGPEHGHAAEQGHEQGHGHDASHAHDADLDPDDN